MPESELAQADEQARLIVEALGTGQWDLYQTLWSKDVERRIYERFGIQQPTEPSGTVPAGSG